MRQSLLFTLALAALPSFLPAASAQDAAAPSAPPEPDPQPSAAAPPEPELPPAPEAAAKVVGQPSSNFEGDPWGDEPANLVAGAISLRVMLQTRYQHTFAKPSPN